MKTKLIPSLAAGTMILITAALSEPPSGDEPIDTREQKVRAVLEREVVSKLHYRTVRFTRAGPSGVRRQRTELDPRQLVGTEERWPFRVVTGSRTERELRTVRVHGYVRLSDDEVFVFEPISKRYLVAAEHPQLRARGKQDGFPRVQPPKAPNPVEVPKPDSEKPL